MGYAERKEQSLQGNVPNLRFPEFSGEWTNCKIKQLCEIATGNKNTQDKSDDGLYPFYVRSQTVERINSWTFDGEAILTAGDGVGVGKVFHYSVGKIGVHQRVYILSNFKCDSRYLFHYFSSRFYGRVKRMSAKNSVDSVRMEMIADMPIYLASKEEQYKIGKILSLLDDRIATQIKIIEDLKKLRSAISNKYLYDKSWPKYKISEIATLGRGRVISSKEIGLQRNPIYPVYSSQTSNDGVMGYLDTYDFDGEYITWTTDGANAGTVFYRNGQFNCTNVCGTIKVGESFDAYCLSTILQTATARYVSTNLANPKLMNNTMASIVVRIPDIKIQKYWSSILRKMEEKLSVEATILLALQQQKQYLLAQMFI